MYACIPVSQSLSSCLCRGSVFRCPYADVHARLQTQGLSCARNLVHEALAFRTRILLSGRLYFSRTCSTLTCMMRRAFLTVACWTAVSRALGFVRDLLMAAFLRAGLVAEACMLAFRFPNLFRHVFAEGAFSAALTPMCTLAFKRKVCPAHGTSYTKRSPSGHAFCCLDGCISPGLALS